MKNNQETPPEIFPVENMPEIPAEPQICETAKKSSAALTSQLKALQKSNQKTARVVSHSVETDSTEQA